jgi:hypothetical protein
MPTSVKIVATAAGSVIAYRLVTRPLRKKHNATKAVALLLVDELASAQKKIAYLADLMDEADVMLDQFDVIALSNM